MVVIAHVSMVKDPEQNSELYQRRLSNFLENSARNNGCFPVSKIWPIERMERHVINEYSVGSVIIVADFKSLSDHHLKIVNLEH